MRILMASHGYPPIISGVTLVAQKIARAMVRKGHTVTIVTASENRSPYVAEDQGVRVIRVRSLANPFWEEGPIPVLGQKALEEIAEEVQPDILHTHDAAVLGWQLARLRRETGVPLVGTCHFVPRFVAHYLTWDDEPHEAIESLAWAYSINFFNRLDRVVFVTVAQRDCFLENGLEAPMTIISNGIDTSRYYPAKEGIAEVEARYTLPLRPRILFVGRLARDKEIDVLIRAMACGCARFGAHLLLVGRGDDRERLEDIVAELDLGSCVHFLGFVPEEDLPALYRAVDLFAIASTCEVQSLPTLQALATKLPVVAVNAMALPELVHDGVNGFLVPPDDPQAMAEAMIRILGDADLRSRMGQASLEIVEPHSETHTFDQYEALYHKLIDTQKAEDTQAPQGGNAGAQTINNAFTSDLPAAGPETTSDRIA